MARTRASSQRAGRTRAVGRDGQGPSAAATAGHAGSADGKLLLTVDEAAQRLGIGRTLMYSLISAGEVQAVPVGRLRRVPSECLTEYVDRLRKDQAKGALAAMVSLVEQGLADGALDAAFIANLEAALARLRLALAGQGDTGRLEDSAA
jgi:excisionase family DNA binding protein